MRAHLRGRQDSRDDPGMAKHGGSAGAEALLCCGNTGHASETMELPLFLPRQGRAPQARAGVIIEERIP